MQAVPACTSINVDHEVEPVPTPVPSEVHQDLKILKEKSAGKSIGYKKKFTLTYCFIFLHTSLPT